MVLLYDALAVKRHDMEMHANVMTMQVTGMPRKAVICLSHCHGDCYWVNVPLTVGSCHGPTSCKATHA